MVAIGKLVTNVATKCGLCSRKSAIRIATETGQKLVDESTRLGRDLNIEEIESVFSQCIPKRLKPTILTSPEQTAKEMLKRGAPQETVDSLVANPEVAGLALTIGRKKAPIFVKTNVVQSLSDISGIPSNVLNNSLIAHELEHALEYNGRVKNILHRRIIDPILLALKKDKKAYIKQINKDNIDFQIALQTRTAEALINPAKALFNPAILIDSIKSVIQELGKGSKQKLKLYEKVIDLETPAYITGNNIEKYATKDSEIIPVQGCVANIYKAAGNVLTNMA